MSMLLQQIRRATYSRRATAAALTPPLTFSRFYSTNNRVLGPLGTVWGEILKNGSAIAFMFGTFYVVDYGGYRERSEEQKRLDKIYNKERKAYNEAKKQLNELNELRETQMTMAEK